MGKKVLLSIPDYSSFYPGIHRAFKYMGFEVANFDYRKFNASEKLMTISGRKKAAYESLNHRLCSFASAWRPDIFLTIKGETVFHDTIKMLKKNGAKTVNWFPDYVNAFELALRLSSYYDYFFHFDPLSVSKLKKAGRKNVYYLPFAADILPDDKKLQVKEKKYEVSFIGNYDNYRAEYLKSIGDLGLNIWGDSRWAKSVLSHCYRGTLANFKFAGISRASKININIQHEYSCEGLVLRPFEVLGASAFLLTERCKDVDRLFKDNVATFGSPEELRNKIIYFLTHDKERDKLSNRGYSAVKIRNTYLNRIRRILSYNPSTKYG